MDSYHYLSNSHSYRRSLSQTCIFNYGTLKHYGSKMKTSHVAAGKANRKISGRLLKCLTALDIRLLPFSALLGYLYSITIWALHVMSTTCKEFQHTDSWVNSHLVCISGYVVYSQEADWPNITFPNTPHAPCTGHSTIGISKRTVLHMGHTANIYTPRSMSHSTMFAWVVRLLQSNLSRFCSFQLPRHNTTQGKFPLK